MEFRLAFIGFGTVGRGLMQLLTEKQSELKNQQNFQFKTIAIHDIILGTIYNENGINGKLALDLAEKRKSLAEHPDIVDGWDSERIITQTSANVIVEITPTNIKTGEPGLTHVRTALGNKKHVVTTNKGPVALALKELKNLATENGVDFRFEGTVMSGTPVFHLTDTGLAGAEIKRVRGILNGTTNYILTQMENGIGYKEALHDAQLKGYAEAVPDADVLGWDAKAKVLILANVLMGAHLEAPDIHCEGITNITLADIQNARANGKRWKLIGSVEKTDSGVSASVKPLELSENDFLAGISGITNALSFDTDTLGEVTIIGPGAGKIETGFSLLTDLLAINRNHNCSALRK